MLPRQCITLGATGVFPCLCTAVEVAVVRQGAGEGDCAGASHGGRTGPAQKFRVWYFRGRFGTASGGGQGSGKSSVLGKGTASGLWVP